MPLLDHFHPPLSDRRPWEGFHNRWASAISDSLNGHLPEGYYASPQIHHGSRVEIDVATLHESPANGQADLHGHNGSTGVLTLPESITLAAPELVISGVFPPDLEVLVYNTDGGPNLVAAIELVSPANKDRPETRRAFAVKCAGYLQQGMGLIVVDVVTIRRADFLAELFQVMERPAAVPVQADLQAISFRPILRNDSPEIELRIRGLEIGRPLPELPLAIGRNLTVSVNFEAAYEEARLRSRIP